MLPVLFQGKLYLGTNSGVCHTGWPVRFTETSAAIDFIPQLSGRVWDMRILTGIFSVCTTRGYLCPMDESIEQVSGLRGVWSCVPHYTDPDKLWVGTYEGFIRATHAGKMAGIKGVAKGFPTGLNFEVRS